MYIETSYSIYIFNMDKNYFLSVYFPLLNYRLKDESVTDMFLKTNPSVTFILL